MKLNLKIILSGLLLSLFSGCFWQTDTTAQQISKTENGSAQSNLPNSTNQSEIRDNSFGISKVYKIGGWKLPEKSSYEIETSQIKRTIKVEGKSFQVYETKYKPTQNIIVEADEFYLINSKELQIKPTHWIVRSIRKFEFNNRPFCYLLRATLVYVDDKGEVTSHLAMTTTLAYYDEDADGTMEAFEYNRVYPEIPNHIPKWINETAK